MKDQLETFSSFSTQEETLEEENYSKNLKNATTSHTTGKDTALEDNELILPYRLTNEEYSLKMQESNLTPVIKHFVELFARFPKDIQLQRKSIEFLERAYYVYPKQRKEFEDCIVNIMANINQDSQPENKREAAKFLYKLIYRDASPEFRTRIENRDSFSTLYNSEYFT